MDPLKDFLTSDSLRAHDILKYVKAFAKTNKQTNEQINQKNAEVLKVQSSVDLIVRSLSSTSRQGNR